MPWLMVGALLGLAVVVLIDVGRAPQPETAPITPAIILGLARLRTRTRKLPPLGRRPRATPTFYVEQPDAAGEVDARPDAGPEVTALPSVIVES